MRKLQFFLLSSAVIALVSCASIPRQKLNQLDSLKHITVIATYDADRGRLTEVWADSYSLNVDTRLMTFSCPCYAYYDWSAGTRAQIGTDTGSMMNRPNLLDGKERSLTLSPKLAFRVIIETPGLARKEVFLKKIAN